MKTKRLVKIIALLMVLLVFTFSLSIAATANPDKNGSITLNIKDTQTGTPIADMTFRLYFFAKAYDKSEGIDFDFVSPYDEASVDLKDLQDSYLPIHLTYFAISRSLEFTEKSTDENGVIVFDNLTPGLYLIVPLQDSEEHCNASPFIVSVPEYDHENKQWIYDVDASPKINGDVDDSGKDTYITVVKRWETDKAIPESITVVLLRDFKEYVKIELNEENNWHYRWDSLPKNHVWNVVESIVPDGYTVSYETSSNTVTIINKYNEEGTTEPGEGTTRPSSGEDDDDGKDDLADTGQLNWPIPVFAVAGLLLFSIGWAVLNFGKKEN
ncbi:MAG: Cna B-type domain-containing protein [Clostridia bacterium]|nr:Cna B-type domain-containing protein [Clostridia bacterium]